MKYVAGLVNDSQGENLKLILSEKVQVDECFLFSALLLVKQELASSHQQICRVDQRIQIPNSSPDLSVIKRYLIFKVKSADLVIVSDYGKGFVSDELSIINNAKFVSVDPKPSRLLQYESPDLLTPNRMEALELAGKSRLMRMNFLRKDCTRNFRKFSPTKLSDNFGADGMLLEEKVKFKR